MAGFNGQEAFFLNRWKLGDFLKQKSKSIDNGCSLEDMRDFLTTNICTYAIPGLSAELCADYALLNYDMVNSTDDERVLQQIQFTSR